MGKLMSATECARHLGVRPDTVLEWLRSGQLPALRLGSRWAVSPTDVDEFIRERARQEANTRRPRRGGRPAN